jgi:hypothetical protein
MSKRTHIDPKDRTWEEYPGELPKPLQVLVFKTGKSAPFHAMCIQFAGIDARGMTDVEAVNEVLDLLLHYLYDWYEANADKKAKPTRRVDHIYQDAFDFGKTRLDLVQRLKDTPPVRVLVRRETGEQGMALLIREAANTRELNLALGD